MITSILRGEESWSGGGGGREQGCERGESHLQVRVLIVTLQGEGHLGVVLQEVHEAIQVPGSIVGHGVLLTRGEEQDGREALHVHLGVVHLRHTPT